MLKRFLFSLFLTGFVLSGFGQFNMSLVGQLSYGADLSDIWGHVDATGKEYAIVGEFSATSIVDISTPSAPVEVFNSSGASSIWRDLKVWNNHAYIVNETSGGLKIIDMSNLPGVITLADVYQFTGVTYPFGSAHDLYIDENGFAYIMGANNGVGGAIILDLNNNPKVPVEMGRYNDFYLHDGMVRGDTLWGGAVNDGFLTIIDVTNKANPITLATQTTPSSFTHNCWISDDGHTLYTTDEKPNAFLAAYDLSNINNIQELDRIQSSPGADVIPHNVFVLGDYIVTSYYRDGVTIHDVSNPSVMVEVGNYDTSPVFSGNGFNGCWGVYPYLPSGLIIATDIENGLYILNPTYSPASYLSGTVTNSFTNLAIDGVKIELIATSDSSNTNVLGDYQMGVANSGTYNVVYYKLGFESDTIFNLALTAGNTIVQDVQLIPLGSSLLGRVIEQTTSNPIVNTNVLISNGQFTTTLLTDASGSFIVPNFIDGQYDVFVGKWGYLTSCFSNQTMSTSNNPNIYVLERGIYDDFVFDYAWMVSGTVITGDWEKGEPVGTTFGGGFSNPGVDVLTDCGREAYVTGNGGGNGGNDDIDGGITVLTSPIINLSTYSDPYIHFDRWFFNAGANQNDSLTIAINNGAISKIIDFADVNDPNLGQWTTKVMRVTDFVSVTNNTTLTIQAMDVNGGDIVEAGFDNFFVTEGLVNVGYVEEENSLVIYPNPFSSEINIAFSNKELDKIKIETLDLAGRIIDVRAFKSTGIVRFKNDYKKGIYFIKVYGDEGLIKTEKIIKL